ncbi:hypothetical protein MAFF211271_11220 [Ralstonia syzygii subsp. indonesiensis]|nr:hypothetical protein MAFF211271_11220 [Ralstonia pseudosolanacearum]
MCCDGAEQLGEFDIHKNVVVAIRNQVGTTLIHLENQPGFTNEETGNYEIELSLEAAVKGFIQEQVRSAAADVPAR